MNAPQAKPLVYSCSGASSAAQMANHLAVRLDRLRVADMSCIAGLGGDVQSLVRVAHSGHPIAVLDGCPLRCALRTLERHGLSPQVAVELSEHGVPKLLHVDFDPAAAEALLADLARAVARLSVGAGESPTKA